MLPLKVPFLQKSQIEQTTAELLRKYSEWKRQPARPPIDVDEIVEGYLNLSLELDDLKSILNMDDVLGASWFDKKLVCIDSSLEGNDGRFAFTVAHEIAHWYLHYPMWEMEKVTLPLFPRKPGENAQPGIVCRSGNRKADAEFQADFFAARLLMPAVDVRAAAKKAFDGGVPALDGLNESRQRNLLMHALRSCADKVKETGSFSNVSNEAMCYRLLDLKLVEDAKEAASRLF